MSVKPYCSGERDRTSAIDQTVRESEPELTRTPAGGASQAAAGVTGPAGAGDAATLHTISAGIRTGISPLQFMDSIDAGGRQLGNRAFMHWVERLHAGAPAGNTHRIAAQGLQGPGRPLTHLDTLQQAFGHHDIRGMREHTGPVAGPALDALDAEGYTRGGRMALAGAPDLYTQAHEAAHGVQQAALGGRMMLPGGIGAAGDRYERQADAVAQAVVRGESAQPLLDAVTAGPVQVDAASAGAAAPVQMKPKKHKRRNQPRPRDLAGDGMPDPEQAAQELADAVAEQDVPSLAGLSMEFAQLEAEITEITGELINLTQGQNAAASAGGDTDMQEGGASMEDVAEEIVPAVQQISRELRLEGELPDMEADEPGSLVSAMPQGEAEQPGNGGRGYLERGLAKIFPGAQPTGEADARAPLERYITYFFPLVVYLNNAFTERAGQVQTEEHGLLSLRGILNTLATVMLGLMMVGAGLPLDIVGNIFGGVARLIMLLCTLAGKPAEWLLKAYLFENPPSEEDRARVSSNEPSRGPPRGMDWNVALPELVAVSAMTVFLQACNSQCSLSPRMWIHPWTRGRIASMVIRTLLVDIAYLLQAMERNRRLLQGGLRWSATRAALFVSMLYSIFDVVSTYILSYLTNTELAVYLIYQNLRTKSEVGAERPIAGGGDASRFDDPTHDEAIADLFGTAALGMLIHFLAGIFILHFVLRLVNENNLSPWRRQFRAIPNRLVRGIAIALASLRNAVVNILTISLTTSQVSANVIGPLAARYGQEGACFWPQAVAGVCGGRPADIDLVDLFVRIQAGEKNMSDSEVLGIQLFPWLVGLLGLGIPIAYVIALYCRMRRSRRGAGLPLPEGSRAGSEGRDRLVEEDAESGRSSLSPEELQAPATGSVHTPGPPVSAQPGASATPMNPAAQELFEMFLTVPGLTSPQMQAILDYNVAKGRITREEADLIARLVREEVVLGK